MKKFFYEKPTQIMFLDKDGEPQGGIAYKNEVICVCRGTVFTNKDFNEDEKFMELAWINLTDEVLGSYR